MKRKLLFAFLQVFICWGVLWGASTDINPTLSVAEVFGEGMVLQQKDANNIWGTGQPSATVQIAIQGKSASTKVAADGSWMVSVRNLKAGGPYTLKIHSDKDSLLVSEVYVGEVWLATGQSNMERKLSMSEKGEAAVRTARNTHIRFLMVPQVYYKGHKVTSKMQWQTATTPQVANMSAIGYYFACELQKELGVPVGIICCYRGGTPAEAWVKEETLAEDSKLAPIWENYREVAIADDTLYEEKMSKYKSLYKIYNDSVALGYKNAIRPFEPVGPKHHKRPCGLYHNMLQTIIPYTAKGVIWYQGEGNAERGEQYKTLFPALIKQWRADFHRPNLPFYFVQLSNFDHPYWQQNPHWAELRDAQLFTWKSVKNTAMVVSIDKGEENDVHPIYKRPIGERLAACALHLQYGKSTPYSGPVYRSMKVKGSKVEISFDFCYSGLSTKGDSPKGFSVCGSDHCFMPAKARISGNKVIIWADEVTTPVAVRYGWSNWTDANLFNKDGLPATPFRTDNFPLITEGVYYPMKIR